MVDDGNGGTDTATVSITVEAVNDAPVAADDSATATSGVATVINVLGNDTDVDGDGLIISTVGMPGNGTAVSNGDGTITYTPTAGFSGNDSFTYTIDDQNGGTDTATVNVTVDPAPTGDIVLLLVNADTDEILGPIGADGIIDPATLNGANFSVIAQFANPGQIESATLQLNSGPVQTESVEPYALFGDIGPDFSGAPIPNDPFTITVQGFSGNGASGQLVVSETFNLSVGPAPQVPPVAGDDSASTTVDQAVIVSVLDNDSDGNGDPLTITDVSMPSNGMAVANLDGTITYTPNAGFTGSDSFTYTLDDGNGGTDIATVTVDVTPVAVNTPPVAADDTASATSGVATVINVLGNDTDADGDSLMITVVGAAGNGSAVANADGTITYTPNAGYTGPDSFTYTIEDGNGGSDTATVNVTVDPAPTGDIILLLVNADTDEILGPIAANGIIDPSSLNGANFSVLAQFANPDQVASATLQLNDGPVQVEGSEPYALFGDIGTDITGGPVPDGPFTITVQGFSQEGGFGQLVVEQTFNLSVGPVPQEPPVAGDDSASTTADQAVVVSVLDNDSDGNGDPLTITDVSMPSNGMAVDNGDGTITYTPNAGFTGSDTFTYTVDDGNGGTDMANVLVVVEAPVPPMPVNDSASTETDSPVLIDVLANDGDPNLTITNVDDPANGMVVLQNGEILYTPAGGFVGTDTFDYTVVNADGLSSTASVTVTVNEPAPEPTITLFLVDANTDTVVGQIAQNGTLDTSLLANGQSAIEARLTNGSGAESFVFQLDSATFHVENVEPYALFQDFGGDFQAGQLPTDAFQLTVQAFSADNGQGSLIAEENFLLVNGSNIDTIM